MSEQTPPIDPVESKLVTLSRGARARVSAAEGAAVVDETGRSYAAASIALPSLTLSALELAVASAVSAGARGAELAVVCGAADAVRGIEALRELGGEGITLVIVDPGGGEIARMTT